MEFSTSLASPPDALVDGPDASVDGPDASVDGPDASVDDPDGPVDDPDGPVDFLRSPPKSLKTKPKKRMKNEFANPAAAGRKALTRALRPKFREVSELLAKMDRPGLRIFLVKSRLSDKPAWHRTCRMSPPGIMRTRTVVRKMKATDQHIEITADGFVVHKRLWLWHWSHQPVKWSSVAAIRAVMWDCFSCHAFGYRLVLSDGSSVSRPRRNVRIDTLR